jgi:hypothetical protein
MSLLAYNARRALLRSAPLSRSLVVDAPASEWVGKREAIKHHAVGWPIHAPARLYWPNHTHFLGTTDLWRKIRYVFILSMFLAGVVIIL